MKFVCENGNVKREHYIVVKNAEKKTKETTRLSHFKYDSSSTSDSGLKVSNDTRQCVNLNGDQRKVIYISSANKSNMSNNSMNSRNSLQYTPLTSTSGLNYQQFQQFQPFPRFPPQALITGIVPMLKEHTLQPAIWTADAIGYSDPIYVTRNDR